MTTLIRARKGGSSRGIRVQAIAGRYRHLTTHQLTMIWWLYRSGRITKRQLRVVFAAHEMAERRAAAQAADANNRTPDYGLEELQALVGGRGTATARRDLSADVAQLHKLGLVSVTKDAITFAVSIEQLAIEGDLDGFWALFHAFPHHKRRVPVPRRMLRALAAGFGRAETGLIIAMLMRSLFWERASRTYRTDGRTKLAWVAQTLDLSRSAVTEARARLIAIGWLVPQETPQWALNKWGTHDAINTDWSPANDAPATSENPADENDVGPAVGEGGGSGGSGSPSARFSGGSGSPSLNRSSSSSRNRNNRTPGARAPGPAGVSQTRKGRPGKLRKPARPRDRATPNIRDVRPEHLRDPESLAELHRQAVAMKLACDSPAGELGFFALANRALTRGQRPGALFFALLRDGKTHYVTDADEEAAARQLRELRNGPDTRPRHHVPGFASGDLDGRGSNASRALSDDERLVEVCLRLAKGQRGVEPWQLARSTKGWSRERWDDAHIRYRTNQAERWHQGPTNSVVSPRRLPCEDAGT